MAARSPLRLGLLTGMQDRAPSLPSDAAYSLLITHKQREIKLIAVIKVGLSAALFLSVEIKNSTAEGGLWFHC